MLRLEPAAESSVLIIHGKCVERRRRCVCQQLRFGRRGALPQIVGRDCCIASSPMHAFLRKHFSSLLNASQPSISGPPSHRTLNLTPNFSAAPPLVRREKTLSPMVPRKFSWIR